MKAETIIIKVDDTMKASLLKLAEASRRTLSDYLRLIIEDTIKNKVKV